MSVLVEGCNKNSISQEEEEVKIWYGGSLANSVISFNSLLSGKKLETY